MNSINLKNSLLFLFLLSYQFLYSQITPEQEILLESLPPDQRDSVLETINKSNDLTNELEEIYENPETLIERPTDFDSEIEECEEYLRLRVF